MAYAHSISKIGPDHYRLSWTIDKKAKGSRLRFPSGYRRDTDEDGARRFARKWGCKMPQPRAAKTLDDPAIDEIVGT